MELDLVGYYALLLMFCTAYIYITNETSELYLVSRNK